MPIHGDVHVESSLVTLGGCRRAVQALFMHSDIPPMKHGTRLRQLTVQSSVQQSCCDHVYDTQ